MVAVLRGHEGEVLSVAFSADGRHVATGGADQAARLWSVDGTGRGVVAHLERRVTAIAFSPDGVYLAATCNGRAYLCPLPGRCRTTTE